MSWLVSNWFFILFVAGMAWMHLRHGGHGDHGNRHQPSTPAHRQTPEAPTPAATPWSRNRRPPPERAATATPDTTAPGRRRSCDGRPS